MKPNSDSTAGAGAWVIDRNRLSPGALSDKLGHDFGEPIASRLIGYCETVVLGGADWRLAGS